VPSYRTRVLYVPQRPSLLPGSPRAFLSTVGAFAARAGAGDLARPVATAEAWGVAPALWDRDWATLSGGEGQRVLLALGLGLGAAEVLLLDGPCARRRSACR
jgi:ABC-type Mn2+/Zn2+ transport system ATPase subunit